MALRLLGAYPLSFLSKVLLPDYALGDEQAFDYGFTIGVIICICAVVVAVLFLGACS